MCPGEPELREMTAPETVAAGEEIEVAFEVHNFEFSMEGEHGHDLQRDEDEQFRDGDHGDEGSQSGCILGHVHLYVDDLMTNPIAQLTHAEEHIEIPDDIEPGAHTFIARLHSADHKIIEPQVVLEKAFTVQ